MVVCAEIGHADLHARIVKRRVSMEENSMAVLKSSPRPPKNETLQLRVEEDVKAKLRDYAEFIDSSESYVVSEALRLLFRKDSEFMAWLDERGHNGERPQMGAEAPLIQGKKS